MLGLNKQYSPEADAAQRQEAEMLTRDDAAKGLSAESSVVLEKLSKFRRESALASGAEQGGGY